MKKTAPIYYSTYARAIISELTALAVLIRKYSTVAKEDAMPTAILPNVLSLEQIEEALLNPQNSIQPSMAAYATLMKLRRNIGALQERSKNQRNLLLEAVQNLRGKLGETSKEEEKQEINAAIKDLENSYKQLASGYKQLMGVASKVIELEHKVAKLIKAYDEEWEQYRSHFLQELVGLITGKLNVPLSELETQELLTHETWPGILTRFTLANIIIPPALNLENPKYTTYFKLKAYIAIYASLSRRMLPNKPEHILKLLKKLPL